MKTFEARTDTSFTIKIIGDFGSVGSYLTATLADASRNVSEFSNCIQIINTPVGNNVVVHPEDENGETPVTLTFENVTGGTGVTTLATLDPASCPPAPGSFLVGDSAVCYEVSSGVTFSGEVEICIAYDEADVPGLEANLRVLHFDTTLAPDAWADITSTVDTVSNIVCGVTTSLSPFLFGVSTATGIAPQRFMPADFALHQNYPNPFNPTTTITFDSPENGARVTITVYNVAGQRIRALFDGTEEAGRHTVNWDGRDAAGQQVATGVYFFRMVAGDFVQTRKMVMLK